MSKIRFFITLSLLILIPLGIWSKFYTGFGHQWLNNYAGDILYNIFWSLFIALAKFMRTLFPLSLWDEGGRGVRGCISFNLKMLYFSILYQKKDHYLCSFIGLLY